MLLNCLNLYLAICCGNPQGDHLKGGPTNYVAKVMRKSLSLILTIVSLDYFGYCTDQTDY